MATPHERRNKEIAHMDYLLHRIQKDEPMNRWEAAEAIVDGMQAWRYEREPAVAEAIRYGLSDGKIGGIVSVRDFIDYPETGE